jgi:hypothetical protein
VGSGIIVQRNEQPGSGAFSSDTHTVLRLIERVSARLSVALADPDAARRTLYRAAWAGTEETMPMERLAGIAAGLPADVTLDFDAVPPDAVFPPALARMVLNVLLLAADSLPEGGIVALAGRADDLFFQIAGSKASWPAGLALCLVNEAEALKALDGGASLQMAFTALLAHASGIRLSSLFSPAGGNQPAILHLG